MQFSISLRKILRGRKKRAKSNVKSHSHCVLASVQIQPKVFIFAGWRFSGKVTILTHQEIHILEKWDVAHSWSTESPLLWYFLCSQAPATSDSSGCWNLFPICSSNTCFPFGNEGFSEQLEKTGTVCQMQLLNQQARKIWDVVHRLLQWQSMH